MRRRTVLSIVVLALTGGGLAGCGGDQQADDLNPSGPEAAGEAEPSWGPLAVVEGPPNPEEALLAGEIDISDRCVTMKTSGAPLLLVWPSEGVSWDPDDEVVVYDDGQQQVELSDGDEVELGGGSGSELEEGSNRWLAEPEQGCAGRTFVVGSVVSDG